MLLDFVDYLACFENLPIIIGIFPSKFLRKKVEVGLADKFFQRSAQGFASTRAMPIS